MRNFIRYVVATVLFISIHLNSLQAQTRYVIKIKSINGETIKGNLLFAAGDSVGINSNDTGPQTIRLSTIKSIAIHKKGKMGRSILHGAGIGAAAGGLLGFLGFFDCKNCMNFDQSSSALVGAITGGVVGVVAGGVVGATSKHIKINSDPAKFDYFKALYFPQTTTLPAAKQ